MNAIIRSYCRRTLQHLQDHQFRPPSRQCGGNTTTLRRTFPRLNATPPKNTPTPESQVNTGKAASAPTVFSSDSVEPLPTSNKNFLTSKEFSKLSPRVLGILSKSDTTHSRANFILILKYYQWWRYLHSTCFLVVLAYIISLLGSFDATIEELHAQWVMIVCKVASPGLAVRAQAGLSARRLRTDRHLRRSLTGYLMHDDEEAVVPTSRARTFLRWLLELEHVDPRGEVGGPTKDERYGLMAFDMPHETGKSSTTRQVLLELHDQLSKERRFLAPEMAWFLVAKVDASESDALWKCCDDALRQALGIVADTKTLPTFVVWDAVVKLLPKGATIYGVVDQLPELDSHTRAFLKSFTTNHAPKMKIVLPMDSGSEAEYANLVNGKKKTKYFPTHDLGYLSKDEARAFIDVLIPVDRRHKNLPPDKTKIAAQKAAAYKDLDEMKIPITAHGVRNLVARTVG